MSVSVFKCSRWTKGNRLFPAVVEVSPAGVTWRKPSMFGSNEIHIAMAKIASVRVQAGPIFADLKMESTGGTDPLISVGHPKQDALRIQELIEQAQSQAARPAEVREDPGETKLCVWCAETIKKAAIVCRFCGRELGEPQHDTSPDIPQAKHAPKGTDAEPLLR